ncbi:hypothetical protein CPI34_00345, partial [Moraxella catarrhalis]
VVVFGRGWSNPLFFCPQILFVFLKGVFVFLPPLFPFFCCLWFGVGFNVGDPPGGVDITAIITTCATAKHMLGSRTSGDNGGYVHPPRGVANIKTNPKPQTTKKGEQRGQEHKNTFQKNKQNLGAKK